MLLAIAAILVGFALLIWSSDKFVDGASAIAYHSGLSPLVIGLTIVGFGTSAPEMMVSGFAAAQGNPDVGVGNAIGSNIANIALILGVTALAIPLAVQSRILKREIPLLIGAMLIAWLLIAQGYLGVTQGLILFAMLFVIMGWLVYEAKTSGASDPLAEEFADELAEHQMPLKQALGTFVIGLVVLLASAKLLVWGAVEIATAFGISDLIIGLTIIAIGTSLPELAASIASAKKGEPDIAIGNVIGSNMFNILGVMAIPGLIAPSAIPADALSRDYPIMVALTVGLFIMAWHFKPEKRRLGRVEGGLLLSAFVAYQFLLFFSVAGAAS